MQYKSECGCIIVNSANRFEPVHRYEIINLKEIGKAIEYLNWSWSLYSPKPKHLVDQNAIDHDVHF